MFPLCSRAADYYWVGGDGDWNDTSHWATTSGGGTLHPTPPGQGDDVYIDENSFPTAGATLDLGGLNTRCRSLTWTSSQANVALTGENSARWRINGDLLVSGSVDWAYNGIITMWATNGSARIDVGGRNIARRIQLDGGSTADFTILSDLVTTDRITVASGGVTFTPNIRLRSENIEMDGNGPVDYTDVTLESSRKIQITTNAAELPFLTTCQLLFTGPDAELDADGAPSIYFERIEHTATAGNLTFDGLNGASISAVTIGADSILLGADATYRVRIDAGYLRWAPGSLQLLPDTATITIRHLSAIGECTRSIILQGDTATFLIADAAAIIDVRNLYVEDVEATGGNAFPAPLSSGRGETTGWNFTDPNGTDRYWVGGSGRWNEPEHWAYSSGGAPGACPPSPTGNAIFDAASFNQPGQTVTLTPGDLRINNLDWRDIDEAARMFTEHGAEFYIYGSMYLHPDLTWTNERPGLVRFVGSDTGRRIRTHGRTMEQNFTFAAGAGGDWTLSDDLIMDVNLIVSNGRLNTNGHTISGGNITLRNRGFLDMDNSLIRLRDYGGLPTVVNLAPAQQAGTGFSSAGARIVSEDPDGPVDITLRNVNGLANELQCIIAAGVLKLTSPAFYARKVEARASATLATDGRIDSLLLSAGEEYDFGNFPSRRLELDYLRAVGNCFENISISTGVPYTLVSTLPQRGDFLELRNIVGQGPGWDASASIDEGGNTGWDFINEPAPRTLYWVGNEGSWFNGTNWSTTSGGPGGECLPTEKDNVIFDAASFSAPNQEVDCRFDPLIHVATNTTPTCRTLDTRGLTQPATFTGQELHAYGSFYLSDLANFNLDRTALYSEEADTEILIQDGGPGRLVVRGSGTFSLVDALFAPTTAVEQRNGLLLTNGFDVTLTSLRFFDTRPDAPNLTTIDLADSEITLVGNDRPLRMSSFRRGRMRSTDASFLFPASDVTVLTSTATDGIDLRFLNPVGTATLELARVNDFSDVADYGTVFFAANGVIEGNSSMDSLLLSAGREYRLNESPALLEVSEHLRAVGTVCDPIIFSPLRTPGFTEIVFLSGADVAMDYVELNFVDARGSGPFLAGKNSLNIEASSAGWTFQSDPTVQSLDRLFLGPDQDVCPVVPPPVSPIVPDGFVATYQWRNGPATAEFQPPSEGTYLLTITFDGGRCSASDSVTIVTPDYALDLPEQLNACGAAELRISTPDPAATGYTWLAEEGTLLATDATGARVSTPGRYRLKHTLGVCSDSTTVEVITGEVITTTEALIFCDRGEVITPLATYVVGSDTTINETYTSVTGCDSVHTYTVTVDNSNDILQDIAINNAPCNDPTGGSLTVNVAPGAMNYTLLLAGSPIAANVPIEDLSEGALTLTLRYGAGCEREYPVTIGVDVVTLNGSSMEVVCEGEPFVSPRGDSYDIPADVAIREMFTTAAGCDSVHTYAVRVDRPDAILAGIDVTNAPCNEPTGGSLTVNAVTGASGFVLLLDGAPISAGAPVAGLRAGTQTVTLRYGDGCERDYPVTIGVDVVTLTGASTNSACEGEAFITPNGSYVVTNDTTITESFVLPNGCDSVHTYTVDVSNADDFVQNIEVTNASCTNLTGGSLRVNAVAGAAGFELFVDGMTIGAGTRVQNLEQGLVTVVLRFDEGCERRYPVTIGLDAETLTGASAAMACAGEAFVTPDGSYVVINDTTITENFVLANGCDSVHTYTVTVPNADDFVQNITVTNASCTNLTGGTLLVNAVPDASDYELLLDGSPIAAQARIGGLTEGNRTVTLRYGGGCERDYPVTIGLDAETLMGESTAPACAGEAFVTPDGSYVVTSDTTITERFVLANGCDSLHTYTVTLSDADDFVQNIEVTDASCTNLTSGSLTVNVVPGATDFELLFDGAPITAGTPVEGLTEGTVDVVLRYGAGCERTYPVDIGLNLVAISGESTETACEGSTFVSPGGTSYRINGDTTITENFPLPSGCDSAHLYRIDVVASDDVVAGITVTDASCTDLTGGSLTVNVAPGATDFELLIAGAPIAAGTPVEGLTEGTVNVVLRYGEGCERTYPVDVGLNLVGITGESNATACEGSTFLSPGGTSYRINGDTTITENFPLASGCDSAHLYRIDVVASDDIVAGITVTDASCTDLTGGSLTVNVAPGATDFELLFDGAPIAAGTPVEGLTEGTVSVVLRYGEGCERTYPVDVGLNRVAISGESAETACEGNFFVSPGGTSYRINGDTTITENFPLPSGCDSAHLYRIDVVASDDIVAGITVTDASCTDLTGGSLTVNVAPGATDFELLFDGAPITAGTPVEGLAEGTVDVVLRYGEGCERTYPVDVGLNLTGTASGASTVPVCDPGPFVTPQATYQINVDTTITERYVLPNGCDSLHTFMINILGSDDIVRDIVVTNASCADPAGGSLLVDANPALSGYELLINGGLIGAGTPVQGLEQSVVTVVLRYGDGCEREYPVTIGFDPGVSVEIDTLINLCGPTDFVTPLATYAIMSDTTILERYTLPDGCDSLRQLNFLLDGIPSPADFVTATGNVCPGGNDGRLVVADALPEGFFLTYGDRELLPGDILAELVDSAYVFTFIAINGGCERSEALTISSPPSLELGLPQSFLLPDTSARQVELLISGGSPPYTFAWSGVDAAIAQLSCTDCASPFITAVAPTTLTLVVTDALGCSVTRTLNVSRTDKREVYLPTAFSPDGDGLNDVFRAYPSAGGTVISLRVYDRRGSLYYEADDTTVDPGWDGDGAMVQPYAVTWVVRWPDGQTTNGAGMVILMR